jgi:predicted Kef-type K+ transport protein
MDILLNVVIIEPIILLVTLACGLFMSRIGTPPLIGYLIAGFVLYALGFEREHLEILDVIADLGVYLLLFVIGLKLNLKSLISKEVWVSSSAHMLIFVLICFSVLKGIAYISADQLLSLEPTQILILAIALGFSSTVFTVKNLESKGESESRYGQIAIGILIIQDLFAVMILTLSKGQMPSIYALLLLGLPLIKPFLYKICDHLNQGDLLVLFGFVCTLFFGVHLFDIAGLKPDLGAIIMGILLSGHKKSSEIADSLFHFKELFLVAFFVSIGLHGLPTRSDLIIASLLALCLPIKSLIFFALLTRFKLRARTAFLSSSSLSTYSEFGLIVTSVAATQNLLPSHMVITMALTLAFSFFVASTSNLYSEHFYQHFHEFMLRFEKKTLDKSDEGIHVDKAEYLILGMGNVGAQVYDDVEAQLGKIVVGIDHKPALVKQHQDAKRHTILGDATDTDFWSQVQKLKQIKHITLCMPTGNGNILAFEQIIASSYQGKVSVICMHKEDAEIFKNYKIDSLHTIFESAGSSLAQTVINMHKKKG